MRVRRQLVDELPMCAPRYIGASIKRLNSQELLDKLQVPMAAQRRARQVLGNLAKKVANLTPDQQQTWDDAVETVRKNVQEFNELAKQAKRPKSAADDDQQEPAADPDSDGQQEPAAVDGQQEPAADPDSDGQQEPAAVDGQSGLTAAEMPGGATKGSSDVFCVHCNRGFKSKIGLAKHSKACKSRPDATTDSPAEAAQTKRARKKTPVEPEIPIDTFAVQELADGEPKAALPKSTALETIVLVPSDTETAVPVRAMASGASSSTDLQCMKCGKICKKVSAFSTHTKACQAEVPTAEVQAADAAPTKRFRQHAKSKQAVQAPFPQPATEVPAPAASQKAQPREGSARRLRWRELSSATPQYLSDDELRWKFIQSTAGQRVAARPQAPSQPAPARTSATGATLVEAPEAARRCCRHPLRAMKRPAGAELGAAAKKPCGGAFSGGAASRASPARLSRVAESARKLMDTYFMTFPSGDAVAKAMGNADAGTAAQVPP